MGSGMAIWYDGGYVMWSRETIFLQGELVSWQAGTGRKDAENEHQGQN